MVCLIRCVQLWNGRWSLLSNFVGQVDVLGLDKTLEAVLAHHTQRWIHLTKLSDTLTNECSMNRVEQVLLLHLVGTLCSLIQLVIGHLSEFSLEVKGVYRLNLPILDALIEGSQLEFVFNTVPLLNKVVPLMVRMQGCIGLWFCRNLCCGHFLIRLHNIFIILSII